jgi:multiple sugar transport system substrate-binding protein
MKQIRDYLTAFLRLVPGLVLILMLASCDGNQPPATTPSPQGMPSSVTPLPRDTASTPVRTTRPSTAIATTTATRTPPPSPTAPVSTLDVQSDELGGLTITLWHPWDGAQAARLQAILAEFNRTNRWGITVQATAYPGLDQLEQAMHAAQNGGALPDMLVGYNYQALHWDQNGDVLVDLNAYIGDPTWGLSAEEQADFYPAFWSADISSQPGEPPKRLGIPMHRSAVALYYNLTFAQSLGFGGLPETTYDFRVRACAAAEANANDGQAGNDGTGGWLVTPQPSMLVGWIYAFGGEIARPDGRGYQFNTQQTGQALDYLKGLQDSGCAWQSPGVDPATEFAARRALFYAGSLGELPAVQAAFAASGNRDAWTLLPFPGVDGAAQLVTYGAALMVTRSEPRRELAAWLVAEWLVDPPNQARWVAENNLLPTRAATLDLLNENIAENPQWAALLEMLPQARSEPAYASWSVMRWALNDAMAELFDSAFTAGQIPDLLEALNQTALEIFTQVR